MSPVAGRGLLVALAALSLQLGAGFPANAKPPPDPVVHYRVQAGDTLYDLASAYLLSADDYVAVQALNRIHEPRQLEIGRELQIPRRLLRIEPIEAHVESYSGRAIRVARGAVTNVVQGLPVHQGDRIETGPDTFVRLALPDGSHVTLPSQSRFEVQTLRRTLLTGALDRAFLLQAGRSESVVTPMTRPEDRFIIRTPLSVAAVRGTDFRVTFQPDTGRAGVEVVEGAVSVSAAAGPSSALVKPAFGTVVTAGGVAGPEALLAAPALHDPGKVQNAQSVTFDVEPLEQASRYRARIAPDAGLLGPIAEIESDGPRLVVGPLKDGDWFVELTAVSAEGLEGLPRIYGFERILNGASLEAPTIVGDHRQRRWLFNWLPQGDGDHRFRFQLSRAADVAAPVIDEADLSATNITVTNLEPGLYYWRVKSTLVRDGRVYESWSDRREFRLDH